MQLMSLCKLEEGTRATAVSEVLLQRALWQGCQKEPKKRKLRSHFTTKPFKEVVNSFFSKDLRREEKEGGNMAVRSLGDLYPCVNL